MDLCHDSKYMACLLTRSRAVCAKHSHRLAVLAAQNSEGIQVGTTCGRKVSENVRVCVRLGS